MKLRASLFLLAAAGAVSGPTIAQTTQVPANQQSKNTVDPNEMICEKQEILGSRLGKKKVCMTRAQWAELKRQDRQDIEKVQTSRGMQDR